LALNRPVLLADNSGMRELAEKGWARAVPVDSPPSEVAAAALQQLRDPILPQEMDWFSWDDCAQALLELYREIM
jgi:glycosyltransferase involved in cell wall biosynthesis